MLAASFYVSGIQFGAEPRRAVSETTFVGTSISETSFETLRSEDLLAKRVNALAAEKPTFSRVSLYPRPTLGRCGQCSLANPELPLADRLSGSVFQPIRHRD